MLELSKLGQPLAVRILRNWSNNVHSLDVLFISETMIYDRDVETLKTRLGFSCAFALDSVGRSGVFVCCGMTRKLCFPLSLF